MDTSTWFERYGENPNQGKILKCKSEEVYVRVKRVPGEGSGRTRYQVQQVKADGVVI